MKMLPPIPNLVESSQPQDNIHAQKDKLLAYYQEAGPDYATWSPRFNMHFGYYEKGLNPLDREALLENMNRKVLEKLGISTGDETLVDMGCGLGATLRSAAVRYPNLVLKGVTIVPWQVEQAQLMNDHLGFNGRIQILEEDYCQTSFHNNSVDGVLAIESSCYATGKDKADLLSEIYRILKPGGRFVIADGFLIHDRPMKAFAKKVYMQLCDSWALSELGVLSLVQQTLTELGFVRLQVEDISWKVAPSVAHVPGTVLSFLFRQWLFGKKRMSKERWDNLKSPLLTMVIGLMRSYFGYYLVSGLKPR